jgi:hypothetical protein
MAGPRNILDAPTKIRLIKVVAGTIRARLRRTVFAPSQTREDSTRYHESFSDHKEKIRSFAQDPSNDAATIRGDSHI